MTTIVLLVLVFYVLAGIMLTVYLDHTSDVFRSSQPLPSWFLALISLLLWPAVLFGP